MARPRIFVSSTFYDLKYVRADLERFINQLGYEAIRNETGAITFGKDEPPEAYSYRELDMCDIIVSVIGGRYGTESKAERGYSISQVELRKALERGIQVFIFVDRNVLSEYHTWEVNKDIAGFRHRWVDDVRVYKFIEALYQLPKNNPVVSFEHSSEIVEYLRQQWAGLFQRFIQDQKRASEIKVLEEMKGVASTLQQLVEFLTKERRNRDEAIHSILLANHPLFRKLAEVTGTPYRVFFTNVKEMRSWLTARNWEESEDDNFVWTNTTRSGKIGKLTVDSKLFDQGKLVVLTEEEWDDDWIFVEEIETPSFSFDDDDDLPF